MAKLVAFLVELRVAHLIESESGPKEVVRITGRLGASQRRQQRRCVLSKLQLLRSVANTNGSQEAILRGMQSHHGIASQIYRTHNRLYTELQQARRMSSSAVAFHWDGGSYGGLNVNVGVLLDVWDEELSYIKPMATTIVFFNFVSFLFQRGEGGVK